MANVRTYYTLAIRYSGGWTNDFGDWDRTVVAQELEDRRYGYDATLKKDMRIIATYGGEQVDIDAAIATLNSEDR